jgi:hypothetical protein
VQARQLSCLRLSFLFVGGGPSVDCTPLAEVLGGGTIEATKLACLELSGLRLDEHAAHLIGT